MSKLSDWFRRKPDAKTPSGMTPAGPPSTLPSGEPARRPAMPPPLPPQALAQARAAQEVAAADEALRSQPRPVTRYNEEPMAELMDRFADAGVLGEGGMCLVHKIVDRNLGRLVAMKVLRPDMVGNPDLVRGFLAEARVTAQLDHPSIPPVYELGVDPEGTRYFTMKLLGGTSLTRWVTERAGQPTRVIVQELLPIIVKVCEAAAFAHDRGVVHRDIKPDNVMVGRFGEVHLVDWGVYQMVEPSASTGEGQQVGPATVGNRGWTDAQMGGTLQYMAPEQAQGRIAEIDARADIFGIGALLYFALGGRGPYSGFPLQEAVTRAQNASYAPLASLNAEVPAGLCRIVHRAMAPSRDDRYGSALDLASDLREFLGNGFHLPVTTFAAGTRIIHEGADGDAAYLIVSGTCTVLRHIDGFVHELAQLGPGAIFGEIALLSNQPRNASVEARTEVTALVVTREQLAVEMKGSWLGQLLSCVVERYREAEEQARNRPAAAFDLD